MSCNAYKENRRALRKLRALHTARVANLRAEANEAAAAKKPRATFTPHEPAPKTFKPLKPEDLVHNPKPFNSAAEPTLDLIEDTKFAEELQKLLDSPKISPRKFRLVCATVIAKGGISCQELDERFGKVIPHNADTSFEEWPLPTPQIQRDILNIFSNIKESDFIGHKIHWQHHADTKSYQDDMPLP